MLGVSLPEEYVSHKWRSLGQESPRQETLQVPKMYDVVDLAWRLHTSDLNEEEVDTNLADRLTTWAFQLLVYSLELPYYVRVQLLRFLHVPPIFEVQEALDRRANQLLCER